MALREKKKINTAPDPDGILAAILKKSPPAMIERLASCFTVCLQKGYFPDQWKVARLIIIPKGGGVSDMTNTAPKARPIWLLSEVGKTLERVIASRLEHHMADNSIAGLADAQFGFRRGRSTCDALMLVKSRIQEAWNNNCVALAVGLDVANAFNSVPWPSISKALR